MILFLTSSAYNEECTKLNPANHFTELLREALPQRPLHFLYIASSPDDYEVSETYSGLHREAFLNSGFELESFVLLDRRTAGQAEHLVNQADLIFLSGGHVPTQNRFFQVINLKELIRDYKGVVIGSSAGSMNSAGRVYSHPELEGEAVDPSYQRWLTGLGLTEIKILPHLNEVRNETVDGLRMFEDIAFPDSMGETFYALPDGSFFRVDPDSTVLYGEAYEVSDGEMKKILEDGENIAI